MAQRISSPVVSELLIKKSRFIGCVQPVADRPAAQAIVAGLRAQHPGAAHVCWALMAGGQSAAVDDGEPSGTAGRPMLDVLRHQDLEGVLATVVRYFGGVKLGVRGLIEAYGTAAEMAAEEAGAVEMEFHRSLRLTCGYDYSKTLTTNLKKWGFPEGRQNIVYGEKVEIALEVPLSMQAELTSPLGEMSARNFITSPLWGYELLVREKWR